MTNKKRMARKANNIALWIALFAISLLGVSGLVMAYSGSAQTVIENVQNYYAGVSAGDSLKGGDEEVLGAANRPIYYVYDYVNGLYVSGLQIFDSSGNATIPRIEVTNAVTSSILVVTTTATITGDLAVNTSDFYVDVSEDRVGINTSTPDYTFHIATSTGATLLYVDENGDFVVDSTDLFVDVSANRVGINSSTPLYDLTVVGTLYSSATATLASGLAVTGSSTLSSALTVTGESLFSNVSWGGSVTDISSSSYAGTYNLTAANVCDNSALGLTSASGTITWAFPATSTLFSDCLDTNGDYHDLVLINSSAATTSVISAGTGGTLLYSSTTTIATSKAAMVRILRDTYATYKALLINLPN